MTNRSLPKTMHVMKGEDNMRNKPVLSRKTPQNMRYNIVFNGVKIFTVHSVSRIHSKVDGAFICSIDKNKLYGFSALCGSLSMCISVFMIRALLNWATSLSIVAALLLFLLATVVSYILYKIMILLVCVKSKKNTTEQNESTLSSCADMDRGEDKRIGFMIFAGAMILFNVLVLIS